MFWVYIVESETAGKRYVGHSKDLNRRLGAHNDPHHKISKYTSKMLGPWRLVYSEQFDSRSAAMRRERWLKSGTGRRWLNEKLGGASPPVAD